MTSTLTRVDDIHVFASSSDQRRNVLEGIEELLNGESASKEELREAILSESDDG